jgi:hypothetical protein
MRLSQAGSARRRSLVAEVEHADALVVIGKSDTPNWSAEFDLYTP